MFVPQEDAADLGGLIMSVGAEEIEPPAEEEERPPRPVAEIVRCVAVKERPQQKRPDVLTMAAMFYHFGHISKSKKKTAHNFGLSAVDGAKQVRGYVKSYNYKSCGMPTSHLLPASLYQDLVVVQHTQN